MKVIQCDVRHVIEERYQMDLTDEVIAAIEFDINSEIDKDYYPVEITREMVEDVLTKPIDKIAWNRPIFFEYGYETTLLEAIHREIQYLVHEGYYTCTDDYEDYSETTIIEVPDDEAEKFSRKKEWKDEEF